MSNADVPRGEMPHLPIRRRNGDPTEPPQIEDLLGDGADTAAAQSEWQPVSKLLQAANGPATFSELNGEAAAMAAFRRGHLGAPTRQPLVRLRMLTTLLSGKIAASLACAALGLTGAAGAAFANVLPAPIQNLAHDTIGAPAHHSNGDDQGDDETEASASPSVSPASSESPEASESELASASGSASANTNAANGLCVAWSNAVSHNLEDQVGFRDKLGAIAGSTKAEDITTFCTTFKHSGSASATPGSEGDHGSGDHGDQGKTHQHGAPVSPTPAPTGAEH
jgi:hypothetical protein